MGAKLYTVEDCAGVWVHGLIGVPFERAAAGAGAAKVASGTGLEFYVRCDEREVIVADTLDEADAVTIIVDLLDDDDDDDEPCGYAERERFHSDV